MTRERVDGDPDYLQRALSNLVDNAVKYTADEGTITLGARNDGAAVVIEVSDDGIGIPEGELPHVFERFRQVDGSATRAHAGMGIGLALARSLVELHGGSIWVSSVVGQGSRFTFAIPIRGAERRATDSGAVAAAS